MSCEKQLRTLDLSGLEKRRLRGHLFAVYSFLGRCSGEGGADLSSLGCDDRMCENVKTLELASSGTGILDRWAMPQCLRDIWQMP